MLPFSLARLQAAAALAARFTAAWDSWSWRQPPAAWLAALKPMAAASLYPALAQAAGTPAVLAQRTAARQAATATVDLAAIRDLTPGSVTVTVSVRQIITSASGTSTVHRQPRGHRRPRRRRLVRMGHRARQRRQQLRRGEPVMAHPAADRGPATITLTAAAALLLLIAVLTGAVAGITEPARPRPAPPSPPGRRGHRRHPRQLPGRLFEKAGAAYGIPWTVLAAIGFEESGFGADDRPVQRRRARPDAVPALHLGRVTATAATSWTPPTPSRPPPACCVANGAPGNLQQAIFAYNHASWYVDDVLAQAARYAAGGAQAITAARQRPVPAAGARPAARRRGREGHRLRREPARQAVPVRRHRAGRL